MNRLALSIVTLTLTLAACTVTNTRGDDPASPASPSPSPSTSSTAPGEVPPATVDQSVSIGAACAEIDACGGTLAGTYDFAGGCVGDVLADAKAECPGLTIEQQASTVRGTLVFAGSAIRRDVVGSVSATVLFPPTCTFGSCTSVEKALRSSFDSASCTPSSGGCRCAVAASATDKTNTTFTVSGNVATTADGQRYTFCERAGSLTYRGASAGAEDGTWTLKKR